MRSERFKHLAYKERTLVEIVEEHVWDNMGGVEHVPYGYETYIPQNIRNILGRFSVEDNSTARHVRHAPDALIVQQNADVLYLVDYKSTTVPMWSPRLIGDISRNAGRNVDWKDIGVIHTASYDNYAKLQKIGVKVAVLTYIAYHERFLLCDYIEKIEELRRAPVAFTDKGSGKDVINFDASQMRTLEEFLVQTHGAMAANIAPQIQVACSQLQQLLPVEHDKGSPLFTG
jgi:hypothetical protein